jgi:hypothetical protein
MSLMLHAQTHTYTPHTTHTHVPVHVCVLYTHICTYIHIHIYIHTYIHTYIYTYIHIHIYRCGGKLLSRRLGMRRSRRYRPSSTRWRRLFKSYLFSFSQYTFLTRHPLPLSRNCLGDDVAGVVCGMVHAPCHIINCVMM